jgi:hypothetical protein
MPVLARRSVGTLATASAALVAGGILAVAMLHAFEPSVDPRMAYVSDYVGTPNAPLLTFAYVAIGAGALVLGAAAGSRAATALLSASALAVLGMVLVPEGRLHVDLVRVAELGMMAGLVLLARAGPPEWRRLRAGAWSLLALSVAAAARVERWLPWPGLLQRLFFAAIVAWLGLAAWRLRAAAA